MSLFAFTMCRNLLPFHIQIHIPSAPTSGHTRICTVTYSTLTLIIHIKKSNLPSSFTLIPTLSHFYPQLHLSKNLSIRLQWSRYPQAHYLHPHAHAHAQGALSIHAFIHIHTCSSNPHVHPHAQSFSIHTLIHMLQVL